MSNKFKRILSLVLSVAMVITGLQISAKTEVAQAAQLEAGQVFYVDLSNTGFNTKGAIPRLWACKNSDGSDGNAYYMEVVPGETEVYQATLSGEVNYVSVARWNPDKKNEGGYWNSSTPTINIPNKGDNYLTFSSWNMGGDGTNGDYTFSKYSVPASYRGQTIYVKGSTEATVKAGSREVTGTPVYAADLTIDAYRYDLPADAVETDKLKIGETEVEYDSSKPCYNDGTWTTYAVPVVNVTFEIGGPNGATKVNAYEKTTGSPTGVEITLDQSSNGTYTYDLNSGKSVRFGWEGWNGSDGINGNLTNVFTAQNFYQEVVVNGNNRLNIDGIYYSDRNRNATFVNTTPMADFAGKTIYVKGTGAVTLSDETPVDGAQVMGPDGATGVYKYTFPNNVASGKSFSIAGAADNGTAVTTYTEATPCYDLEEKAWVAYTEPSSTITINVKAPDNIRLFKMENGNWVKIQDDVTSFVYDLSGNDEICLGWYNNQGDLEIGNMTAAIGRDEIYQNAYVNGKTCLGVGGTYVNGVVRTHTWNTSVGDMSLNIPTGTFNRGTSSYYVSTTFYDYYSDVELNGTNRKDLTSDFDRNNGSDDKIQARRFNWAVSNYFNGKLSGSFKPLYFGEFTGAPQTYYLYDLSYNNGSDIKSGLVDSTLNANKNLTMNGVELPYFNKEFLRGANSENQPIGYVFENVQFPFQKNEDGYWEFDSADVSQSLRMKQDTGKNLYYLDRTGAEIKAVNAYLKPQSNGFFPFNDASESAEGKKLNYAFGVRFDIPFAMTADGKYGEEGNKKEIRYDFSGDDDVWVFIDGKLALDIGGDHPRKEGWINFAEKKSQAGSGAAKSFTELGIDLDPTKQHVLTMFYMERGLWESNMKITFNFPQVNTFTVQEEVDLTNVNELFKAYMTSQNLSTFDITVKNYATHGFDKAASSTGVKEKEYNSLNSTVSADKIAYEGSPSKVELLKEKDSKVGNEADVLLVKYPSQIRGTTDANGHRVTIKPEKSESFDASEVNKYLQFRMFNESLGECGAPYVVLKDASGHTIANWANKCAYDGNNNTLTRNKWVTVKVDLGTLKGSNDFDFSAITEVQIGYWDCGYLAIDQIEFHPEVQTVDTPAVFQQRQYDVPTYGSVAAQTLTNATGALYQQKKRNSVDSKTYTIGSNGIITLSDGDSAMFTDQFRIGSYIGLTEEADQRFYTTTWNLAEGEKKYRNGAGVTMKDNRTESADYAVDTEKNSTARMSNNILAQPTEDTILYRSPSRLDDIITPTSIVATYVNKVNTGTITVKSVVEDASGDASKSADFDIRFRNVFGQIVLPADIAQSETINPDGSVTYTGIPVGTTYEIVETGIPEGYSLINITHDVGNDNGVSDVAGKTHTGSVSLGAVDQPDLIVFTLAPNPKVLDKVFYVEAGKEKKLEMNLTELTYLDEKAVPSDITDNNGFTYKTHADVPVTPDSTDVKFDKSVVGEPNQGVANEKYEFNYSGKAKIGGQDKTVTGKVTVYTFVAKDNVYVLDYGLKMDLADEHYGNGLFQNDVVINKYAENTAKLESMKNRAEQDDAQTAQTEVSITGSAIPGTKVVLTPVAIMDQVEMYDYKAGIYSSAEKKELDVSAVAKVMPASIVYYEDNFAGIDFSKVVNRNNDTQQNNSLTTQYGYDEAYVNGTAYSNGTHVELASGEKFGFAFKGTGFEILTRTSNTSLLLRVYDAETCKLDVVNGKLQVVGKGSQTPVCVKNALVSATYEHGFVDQIPLISLKGLPYAGYVVIAQTLGSFDTIKLDGVRIYDPLDPAASDYSTVNDEFDVNVELPATVENIKHLIMGKTNDGNSVNTANAKASLVEIVKVGSAYHLYLGAGESVVEAYTGEFTSKEGLTPEQVATMVSNAQPAGSSNDLMTYLENGPSNELYLNGSAYAVGIKLSDITKGSFLHVGMKAIGGTARVQYLSRTKNDWKDLDGTEELQSAMELYYKIPLDDLWNGCLLLRAKSGTVAITNVKHSNLTLSKLVDDDFDGAVQVKKTDTIPAAKILTHKIKRNNQQQITLTFTMNADVDVLSLGQKTTVGETETVTPVFTYTASAPLHPTDTVSVSRKVSGNTAIYVVKLTGYEAGDYVISAVHSTSKGVEYQNTPFTVE